MRAIELTLDSRLFTVTLGEIRIYTIDSIQRSNGDLLIKATAYTTIRCNPEATKGSTESTSFYFTLDDAQEAQLIKRKSYVGDLLKEMQEAQSKYNSAIEKYLYTPAHDPFKKEVE